jgi:hypothetical protein
MLPVFGHLPGHRRIRYQGNNMVAGRIYVFRSEVYLLMLHSEIGLHFLPLQEWLSSTTTRGLLP